MELPAGMTPCRRRCASSTPARSAGSPPVRPPEQPSTPPGRAPRTPGRPRSPPNDSWSPACGPGPRSSMRPALRPLRRSYGFRRTAGSSSWR
ncbi:hypothetical protein ACFQ3Z_16370 [Streptomyces nogalater]